MKLNLSTPNIALWVPGDILTISENEFSNMGKELALHVKEKVDDAGSVETSAIDAIIHKLSAPDTQQRFLYNLCAMIWNIGQTFKLGHYAHLGQDMANRLSGIGVVTGHSNAKLFKLCYEMGSKRFPVTPPPESPVDIPLGSHVVTNVGGVNAQDAFLAAVLAFGYYQAAMSPDVADAPIDSVDMLDQLGYIVHKHSGGDPVNIASLVFGVIFVDDLISSYGRYSRDKMKKGELVTPREVYLHHINDEEFKSTIEMLAGLMRSLDRFQDSLNSPDKSEASAKAQEVFLGGPFRGGPRGQA